MLTKRQTRRRTCNNPAQNNGGLFCQENSHQDRDCKHKGISVSPKPNLVQTQSLSLVSYKRLSYACIILDVALIDKEMG